MNRHVLALRGFITMAVLPDAQTSPQAVSDLARAWDLARRDDEKRMILSALPKVACQEALSFAEQQRQEAAMLGEVQNAMVSLGQALARAYPQQVRKVLQSVVAEAASPAVQKRAQDSLAQMK